MSDSLYRSKKLKRVYYSGYVPISSDSRLPIINQTPLVRENRLYQADWLLRFYGFKVHDIVNQDCPDLDLEIDPKAAYALRHPELYPVNINSAPYEMILRVPGIGVKSAKKIVCARKFRTLHVEHLKKIGVVWKRAQYFVECADHHHHLLSTFPEKVKNHLTPNFNAKQPKLKNQISLF